MIIVKNVQEIKQATTGGISIYLGMQKKKDASTFNEGHTKLIEEGKKYGNKIVVGFWYEQAMVNYVNPNNFLPELSLEWDKEGCVNWASKQNVDIVWAPEYENEISIFQVSNINYYKKLIDKIWEDEGYTELFSNPFSSEKTKVFCLSRLINNFGWKYMFSWKDGITKYIESHFMSKYTNSRIILIDPIKAPDGLYYSSSYFKYSNKEKEAIAKIEPTIRAFTYPGDMGILKDNIDVFGKEVGLVVQHLKSTINKAILGKGKNMVEIKFYIGKDNNTKYDNLSVLIN